VRVSFRCSEAGFEEEDYALVCGFRGVDATGKERHLIISRAVESVEEGDDWGIYLEYDDQRNGNYGLVSACRLGRDFLELDLKLNGEPGRIEVDLASLAVDLGRIRSGLRRIFREKTDSLILDESESS
jgi:hypothetical protein